MDNITHAVVGALIGRLWASESAAGEKTVGLSPAKAALLGAVLANLPDLDILLYLFSETGYLDHHPVARKGLGLAAIC